MASAKLLIPVALVAVGSVAAWQYPPARLFALAVAGRSPACPIGNAVKAHDNDLEQVRTKDRILAASKRVATDPAGFEQWRTPHGEFWIPAGNQYVLPWNLAEQARKIYGSGANGVQPGDVVLDCGANIGVFTRASLDAGAKLVVAIEPAPENVECLRRNFKTEIDAGRVIVYPKGVWNKDDILTLKIDPKNSAADSFVIDRKDATGGVQIPLVAIDKMVEELKLEKVSFIKMDIEGAEQNALIGGRATIAKHHPRMALSAYHTPTDPERIPALVKEAWPGYSIECGPCAEANGHIRPDILYFK